MSADLTNVAGVHARISCSAAKHESRRTALPVLLTVDEAADLCAQHDARSTR